MGASPSILAVVFDFDDTLAPDSTTKLLETHGFDTDSFWKEDVRSLVEEGYDNTLAWLQLLLGDVGETGRLGALTNERLRQFGSTLDEDFYTGIPQVFQDLREIVARYRDVSIEFYIISSGLREVILGSSIVNENFAEVYGCELGEGEDGPVRRIRRAVTFTEKTRYLFEINKGLTYEETRTNPLLVNTDVEKDRRRIPFENIVYVGDGQTDIPCFSLLKAMGGTPIGVFDPARKDKAKQALLEFLRPQRVMSMHSPRYGLEDDLGSLLRMAVATRCSEIEIERGRA